MEKLHKTTYLIFLGILSNTRGRFICVLPLQTAVFFKQGYVFLRLLIMAIPKPDTTKIIPANMSISPDVLVCGSISFMNQLAEPISTTVFSFIFPEVCFAYHQNRLLKKYYLGKMNFAMSP
jgi:hypothetical protein